MTQYIYETVTIKFSVWTGRFREDYLEIINERGLGGWRFVTFAPRMASPKGSKGYELVFEKKIESMDDIL